MTKARDLANIANGVPNSLITLDANEIPNLDTAKITSGTFADARISSSSVSQHATSFDDSKIQQDLMVLALQQATDANKAAYSLSNSFVEQFEDSTGIDVQTNTRRHNSEYIETQVSNSFRYWRFYKTSGAAGGGYHTELEAYENNIKLTLTSSMLSQSNLQNFNAPQLVDNNTSTSGFHTDSAGVGAFLKIDLGAGNEKAIEKFRFYVTNPESVTWDIQSSSDNSTWTTRSSSWTTSSPQYSFNERTFTLPTIYNSTGNFTSVSKTAPATVSKMGIVVLYKNNAGTATLNTDLVAQVSANNGTDFTTVTLTPRGTFSTGINIAVANNVTVTSGTSCKYKISFANQSSGTKETQVHGVGLIY